MANGGVLRTMRGTSWGRRVREKVGAGKRGMSHSVSTKGDLFEDVVGAAGRIYEKERL